MDKGNRTIAATGSVGDNVVPPVDGPSPDALGNRTRRREVLVVVGQLRFENDSAAHEVRVRNLSAGGLMLELDRIVDLGTPVRLDLPGVGDVAGTVAWCIEGRIGVAFDSPIDPQKAHKPIDGAAVANAP